MATAGIGAARYHGLAAGEGRLKGKEEDAIRNAEKLLQRYSDYNPEANNPSTTVHRLVQELMKWK